MTTLNRRKVLALMGATIAAGGLSAPALAMKKKIKVGALRFTSHSGSFVAFERGYFAEEGLDVEFKFFQAAQHLGHLGIGLQLPIKRQQPLAQRAVIGQATQL